MQVDIANLLLGLLGSLIYAILGYASSKEAWNWKKFLKTFAFALVVTLGLDVSGLTVDVYTAIVGPTAIMVWLQKLIDTAKS